MAAAEMPPPDALSDDVFLSSPASLCYRAAQSIARGHTCIHGKHTYIHSYAYIYVHIYTHIYTH